jgi:hypothetical protein
MAEESAWHIQVWKQSLRHGFNKRKELKKRCLQQPAFSARELDRANLYLWREEL